MTRGTLGRGLVAIGAVAIVVGALGLTQHWGETKTTVVAVTTPSPSSGETPEQFLALYVRALRAGDKGFLVGRLHPAVLHRYGAAQCASAVGDLTDASLTLRLDRVSGPVTFDYNSDGRLGRVDDTYAFTVSGQIRGQQLTRNYHFTLFQGRFTILIDCGLPQPSS